MDKAVQFRDLAIGDEFDFVDDANPTHNTFWERCTKISARCYQGEGDKPFNYRVGSINATVYHVSKRSN